MRTLMKRIAAIAIVSAAVLVIYAYYYAIIDFPFVSRPESFPNNPDKAWAHILGKTEPTVTAEPTEVTRTAEPTAEPTETAENTADAPFSLGDCSALEMLGYTVTDEKYDGSFVLADATPVFLKSDVLSKGKKTVSVAKTAKKTEDGVPYAVYADEEADRLSVEVYMGMLLYDSGDGITVMTPTGEALVRYGYGEYEPAYTRDTADRPLFKADGTVTVEYEGTEYDIPTTLYYYIEDNRFVLSDYDDMTENRGLYFDYPSYYGKSGSHIVRIADITEEITLDGDGNISIERTADWGYSVTGHYYSVAYDYSEGRGFVMQMTPYRGYEDRPIEACYLISEYGYVAYRSLTEFYNEEERYFISSMRMPLTNGEESIGSFYLENGLMMARIVTVDWYMFNYSSPVGYEKLYTDETVMIDGDGNVLDIPYGFEVKAYSSGMILVCRDGKYGYMNSDGGWVIQPTLTYAEPYYCGLAVVGDESGTYLIDTDGNTVIPSGEYEIISHSSSGVISAYGEDGWTIIQIMKKAD